MSYLNNWADQMEILQRQNQEPEIKKSAQREKMEVPWAANVSGCLKGT